MQVLAFQVNFKVNTTFFGVHRRFSFIFVGMWETIGRERKARTFILVSLFKWS